MIATEADPRRVIRKLNLIGLSMVAVLIGGFGGWASTVEISGALIAQIGEQRRIPVTYDQIPELVKHAFIAAEDERFFEHHGIDYFGVVRAVLVDFISGDKTQGASTITMQAARNMFLNLDKTYRRKLQETFVTYRMEHEFTKQEIFGLYLNVIFFGQRSYGVAAAAEAFFGKPLEKLDVAEAATLAGVPKAPSSYNPIVNPEAATARRAYVLRRMRELGYIDAATAEAANKEPMAARAHAPLYEVEAPYVAEMARLELRQQLVEIMDVPRPLDLRQHHHVKLVAGLRDDLGDVVDESGACGVTA